MKILQPSKRTKKSSAYSGDRPESLSQGHGQPSFDSDVLGENSDSGMSRRSKASSRKQNSRKKGLRKERSSGSHGGAQDTVYSDYSNICSDKSLESNKYNNSKARRSKRAFNNSYDERNDVAVQKDSEFDFDTSRLEAMPKEVYVEPVPSVKGKTRRRSELQTAGSDSESEPLELIVDPAKKEFNELFVRGVRLLAMREHSVKEITTKLFDKSDAKADVIHAVVDDLLEKKYLSDERFTESYVRARSNRGFGPVKIKAELKQKGVSSSLIQDYINEGASIWFDNAESQYQKKYGDTAISDYNAWTKRARFMQSRGFTMEHIHTTVPRVEFD